MNLTRYILGTTVSLIALFLVSYVPIFGESASGKGLRQLHAHFTKLQKEDRVKIPGFDSKILPEIRALKKAKSHEKTCAYLRKFLEETPPNLNTYWFHKILADEYLSLGDQGEAKTWLRKGIHAIDELIKKFGDRPEASKLVMSYRDYYRALARMGSPAYQEERQRYKNALSEAAFKDYRDFVLLGMVKSYVEEGQYESAIQSSEQIRDFYEEVPQEEKNRSGYYLLHARALVKTNRRIEAQKVLQSAKASYVGGFDEDIEVLGKELGLSLSTKSSGEGLGSPVDATRMPEFGR